MKRLMICFAALISGYCSFANAADIYDPGRNSFKDFGATASGQPFSGFNIWADVGYAEMNAKALDSVLDNINIDQAKVKPEGVFGGIGAGYNVTFGGSFLVGVDTHVQFSDITDDSGEATVTIKYPATYYHPAHTSITSLASQAKINMDWFGATRLKAGLVLGNSWLVYGHAGVAYAGVNAASDNSVSSVNGGDTLTGWTAGGGVEWMMSDKWSMLVEYSHYDFGDLKLNANIGGHAATISKANMDMDAVMCGVKYHF